MFLKNENTDIIYDFNKIELHNNFEKLHLENLDENIKNTLFDELKNTCFYCLDNNKHLTFVSKTENGTKFLLIKNSYPGTIFEKFENDFSFDSFDQILLFKIIFYYSFEVNDFGKYINNMTKNHKKY